ncbi:MAG: copper resistance protein NlpE N-terminal domain-containing protein [Gelidibacter sp.]|uniref:copper resistance protein NlpE N-terminal domain-containing protein n=1 Tax=Gelidibacter sp. TaxID=2018083 RepID=UPI0032676612
MKSAYINTLCLALVIFATSCNSQKKNETQITDEQTAESTSDNSKTSLDWAGTYEGELPCADCDGIKTVITINQDNTFTIKETYLGKEAKPYETMGTFKWDDKGQKLIFSDPDRHSYFVGENMLTQLDSDGNKITGAMKSLYVLKKITDKLVGKKWHLVTFKGEDIQYKEAKSEHAYIQFKDDFTVIGYTGCNNLQGAYEVEDAQKIKFLQLLNTLKACPEMEIEAEFLKTVNAAASYGFEDHSLIMYDKDHQKLATFKAAN